MKILKIKTILSITLAFSTFPIIIMLFVLFAYTMTQGEERQNEIIHGTQKALLESLEYTLKDTSQTLSDISYGMDFLIFSNSSTRKRIAPRAAKIIEAIRKPTFQHSSTAGIFLYNSQCDYYYNDYKFNALSYIQPEVTHIMHSDALLVPSNTWIIRTIQNNPILFYIVRSRYGAILIAVDPSLNDNFLNVIQNSKDDTTWFFMEKEASATLLKTIETDSRQVLETSVVENLQLVYIETPKGLMERIDNRQLVMLIIIIVLIFLVPAIWLIINFTLLKPLGKLSDSINEIRNGHLEHRVNIHSRINELRIFASSFNDMLDSVSQLKVESYEHKLTASRARLQYLQLQIRPHFYLNCLKNMYSLLDLQDYNKIRQMILALSSYFAHSFRDVKNFVTLIDELNACSSYIDLQNIVIPKAELTFDIESRCVNAQCLPMSVLTFIENCIKHGTHNAYLHIKITAKIIADLDKKEQLWITIQDDGGGFTKESLKELNEYDTGEMIYRHEKIGIANVRYRLWLIYRDAAYIQFRNDASHAIIEIVMPYDAKEGEYI